MSIYGGADEHRCKFNAWCRPTRRFAREIFLISVYAVKTTVAEGRIAVRSGISSPARSNTKSISLFVSALVPIRTSAKKNFQL